MSGILLLLTGILHMKSYLPSPGSDSYVQCFVGRNSSFHMKCTQSLRWLSVQCLLDVLFNVYSTFCPMFTHQYERTCAVLSRKWSVSEVDFSRGWTWVYGQVITVECLCWLSRKLSGSPSIDFPASGLEERRPEGQTKLNQWATQYLG